MWKVSYLLFISLYGPRFCSDIEDGDIILSTLTPSIYFLIYEFALSTDLRPFFLTFIYVPGFYKPNGYLKINFFNYSFCLWVLFLLTVYSLTYSLTYHELHPRHHEIPGRTSTTGPRD